MYRTVPITCTHTHTGSGGLKKSHNYKDRIWNFCLLLDYSSGHAEEYCHWTLNHWKAKSMLCVAPKRVTEGVRTAFRTSW